MKNKHAPLCMVVLFPCLSLAFLALCAVGEIRAQTLPAKEAKVNLTNRLAHESSPYLLQHAHNPVDWYPWGAEAFDKAKKEKKLVFLSIGYSSCHWCHVMEKECFENADVPSCSINGSCASKSIARNGPTSTTST